MKQQGLENNSTKKKKIKLRNILQETEYLESCFEIKNKLHRTVQQKIDLLIIYGNKFPDKIAFRFKI